MSTPYTPEDVKRYWELVSEFEVCSLEVDRAKQHRQRVWHQIKQLKNSKFGGKAPEPEGK